MDDKLKQLYELYSRNGLIKTTDYNTFSSANESQRKQLYDLGKKNGLFKSTDYNTFSTAFSPAKKKSSTELPSQSQKRVATSATVKTTTQKPSASSGGKGNREVFTGFPGNESKKYLLDKSSGIPVWKEYSSSEVVNGKTVDKFEKIITDPGRVDGLNKQFKQSASTSDRQKVFTGFPGKEFNEYRVSEGIWQKRQKGKDDWSNVYNEGAIEGLNKQFKQNIKPNAAKAKFANVAEDIDVANLKNLDNRLNSINKSLVDKEEDQVITRLTLKFPEFTFETSGLVTDEIKVKAPNGEVETFSLDNFSDRADSAVANNMKAWMRSNSGLTQASKIKESEELLAQKEQQLKEANVPAYNPIIKLGEGEGISPEMKIQIQDKEPKKKVDILTADREVKEARKKYATAVSKGLYEIKDRQIAAARSGSKLDEKEVAAELAQLPKNDLTTIRRANEYANDVKSSISTYQKQVSDLNKYTEDIYAKVNSGEITKEQFETEYKPKINQSREALVQIGEQVKNQSYALTDFEKAIDESVGQQYVINEAQGSFGGAMAYKFVKGMTYIPRLLSDELGKDGQERLVRLIVGTGTKEEYINSENRSDIEKALFSLSESMGALSSGGLVGGGPATYAAFFGQSYYEMKDEIDQIEGISDTDKVLLSGLYGAVSSALEKFGIDFAMQKTGLGKGLTNSILKSVFKDLPKDASKEFIEAAILNDAKKFITQAGIRVVGSGLVEGGTESAQALTQVKIKDVYDWAKEKNYFKTKTGWELISDVAYEGYLGMLGGNVMSTVSNSADVVRRGITNSLNKEQIEVLFNSAKIDGIPEALLTNLKASILKRKISNKDAQEIYNSYNELKSKIKSIPEEYTVEDKSVALDLMLEKDRLNKKIEGKDKNLVQPIINRITEIDNQLKKIGENATKKSTEQQQEVTAEGGGVQRQGVNEGQPEVGQGEGPVGQATQQGTDLGNRPVESRGEAQVTARQVINRPAILTSFGGVTFDSPIQGDTYVEGQQVVFEDRSTGRIYELGNVDEVMDSAIPGLQVQEETISVTPEGKVSIDGNNWNIQSELPTQGVEYNPDGTVMRVSLKDDNGNTQMFDGQQAVDIAYQIELQKMQTPEQQQFINDLLEQDEEFQAATESIKPTEVETVVEEKTAPDTVQVEPTAEPTTESTETEQPAVESEVEQLGKLLSGTDQQIEEEAAKISNKRMSKIVSNAARALSKIAPNVKFVIHDNDDSYRKATGEENRSQSSNGEYNPKTKTVHINLTKANARTVAHEVFHAILLDRVSSDAQANAVTKRMIEAIANKIEGDPELKKYLEDFAANYKENIQNEEKLAELVGKLAENYMNSPQTIKDIIKRWLNKLASMFSTQPITSEQEVMEVLNTIARKVATGKKIRERQVSGLIGEKVEDLSRQSEGSPGSIISASIVKRKQLDRFIDKSFNTLIEYNDSNLPDKIKMPSKSTIDSVLEKSGGAAIFINSDGTKVGVRRNGESLQGGWRYTYLVENQKSNIGFAATSTAHVRIMHKIATSLAEVRDSQNTNDSGKPIAVFVTIQNAETMLGEWYAGEFFMEGIDEAITKNKFKGGVKTAKKLLIDALTYKSQIKDLKDKIAVLNNNKLSVTNKNEIKSIDEKIEKLSKQLENKVELAKKEDNKRFINLINSDKFLTHDGRIEIAKELASKNFSFGYRVNSLKQLIPLKSATGSNREIKKALLDVNYGRKELYEDHMDEVLLDKLKATGYDESSIGGITMGGFYLDPYVSEDDFMSNRINGVEHAQFNESFSSNGESFLLNGAINVNELSPEMGYPTKAGYDLYNAKNNTSITKSNATLSDRFNVAEFLSKETDNDPKYLTPPFTSIGGSMYTSQVIKSEEGISPRKQLSAPNGKPSNLNEKQWNQVRTPEFKKWFGDWENDPQNASKVVDENGEPLVVYHGTRTSFDEFSFNVDAKHFRLNAVNYSFWFTSNKKNSELYGNQIMEVFLNSRNPIEIDYTNPESYREIVVPAGKPRAMEIREFDEKKGMIKHSQMSRGVNLRMSEDNTIDGIIHRNIKDMILSDNFQVFNPNQIKSATENVGTFSTEERSIRKQLSGLLDRKQNQNASSIVSVARKNGFSEAAIEEYLRRQGFTDQQIQSAMSINDNINVNEIFDRSKKALQEKQSSRSITKAIRFVWNKFIDRQSDIKRLITGIGTKPSQKAFNMLVTRAGAKGWANYRYKEAEGKIYKGLKEKDIDTLDKLIYVRRIISINENRAERGMNPYKGIDGYSEAEARRDLQDMENTLGEKKFKDLSKRADAYFDVFAKSLENLYKSGRITEEVYNNLKYVEYSPIATIKYIIGDNLSLDEIDRQAEIYGITRKDIATLTDKNENEIIMDSQWLLMMNLMSVEARAWENRMLNSFADAINSATDEQKVALSEYVRVAKSGETVPAGFVTVNYSKDGKDQRLFVKADYATQLLDIKTRDGLLQAVSKLTGTQILRFFATGANAAFVIGNTAVDFANILFFSNVYGNFKTVGGIRLTYDVVSNFMKKLFATKTYKSTLKEFMEHGGAMDFMSSDGLRVIKKLKPAYKVTSAAQKTMVAVTSALSYMGEASELSFRLAAYSKVKENLIKQYKKDNNGNEPTGQDLEDIMFQAARESRSTVDFSQGGSWAKPIDLIMPYFNAALQGFRRPFDFAKKNPTAFAWALTEAAMMSGGVAAMSLASLAFAIGGDDEEEKKRKMIDALNSISEHEKATYHIIFTGKVDKDGEYEYVRIKKLPFLSMVTTLAEQIVYSKLLSTKEKEYSIDSEVVKSTIEKSLPLMPNEIAGRNPLVSALLAYNNYDTFTGEKVFREPRDGKIAPEAEGMYDDKVDNFYKQLAPKLGMSPIRTKAFVEKIITSENTNPAIALLNSTLNGIFGKDTSLGEEFKNAMEKVSESAGRKLVRKTNKDIIMYNEMDKAESEEILLRTEKYNKEQKTYQDIRKIYDEGGKMTNGELISLIKERFDKRDVKNYVEKYYTYIQNMGANKQVLDILYEQNAEIQALKIYNKYGRTLDGEDRQEIMESVRTSRKRISPKAMMIYREKYQRGN